MGGLKAFLRGLAVFVCAVVLVTLALLAGTFGYSLVACRGVEDAVGWALLMVVAVFLGVPVLVSFYLAVVAGVSFAVRPAFARFGAARVLGAFALLLVVIVAATAGITAVSGSAGSCNILG